MKNIYFSERIFRIVRKFLDKIEKFVLFSYFCDLGTIYFGRSRPLSNTHNVMPWLYSKQNIVQYNYRYYDGNSSWKRVL